MGEPVTIPVSYRRVWQDGFGARGWKLDAAIEDPAVIAATADTGDRIATSVFVHDIFDHYLCGLPMSGHRNEAVALVQLAERTGSDPADDFARMVREDLLHGQVNGEGLRSFLPAELLAEAPADVDGRALIDRLRRSLGEEALVERLVERFFELGREGAERARAHYRAMGLDYRRRAQLAQATQSLLTRIDRMALDEDWEWARGVVTPLDATVRFALNEPHSITLVR